jgi:hypothetical protein
MTYVGCALAFKGRTMMNILSMFYLVMKFYLTFTVYFISLTIYVCIEVLQLQVLPA